MNIGIVVAAGKGTRMNAEVPKQMLPYRDSTVLECAARPFAEHPDIDEIVIVTPKDGTNADFYLKTARALQEVSGKEVRLTKGGKERGDSVRAGLDMCGNICREKGISENSVKVLIHDGARADLTTGIIDRNLKGLDRWDAVCTAVPSVDSMRIIPDTDLNSLFIYPIMDSKVIEKAHVLRSDASKLSTGCDSPGLRCCETEGICRYR